MGDSGIILSSVDGITWNNRLSGATDRLLGITYGSNTFVVVEIDGTIFQSDIADIQNNPPAVTTMTSTAIKATSATLNGNINPRGLSTTYYFEYGLTIDYGNRTDVENVGSGYDEVAVSANLNDLIAEFTYHYKLVASNNAGTTEGLDQTFSTIPENVGSISGRAAINIAGHNDLSVANAVVSLQGTSYTATTDSNGNFTLPNIPFGNYNLIITAPNLNSLTQSISLSGQILQLMVSQMTVPQTGCIKGDVNGDGLMGLDDAIYILQVISRVR